jgi:RHS repeat-associated protein
MVEMLPPAQKVTENFTGKEHDDEIALDYFGARYLDPMLGMWISVDPARQFASPYLYAGNGANPINVVDPDGNFDFVVVAAAVLVGGCIIHYNYHNGNLSKWWIMLKNEAKTRWKNLGDNVEKIGNAVEKSAEPFNHVTGTEYDALGVRDANKFLSQELAPDMPKVIMKGTVGNYAGMAKEILNEMTEEKEYKLQKINSAPVFEDPDVNNLMNGAKNNE